MSATYIGWIGSPDRGWASMALRGTEALAEAAVVAWARGAHYRGFGRFPVWVRVTRGARQTVVLERLIAETPDAAGTRNPGGREPAMRVLDLFSGTGSATEAFRRMGHEVVSVDVLADSNATVRGSVLDAETVAAILAHGPYDFVWASPPCTAFSVAVGALTLGRKGGPSTSGATGAGSVESSCSWYQ